MAKTTKNNNTNNPNTDPNKKNSADMYDILKDIRDEIKKQNSSNKSNSSSTSSSSGSDDKKEHKILKKLYDDSMGSLGTIGTMFGGPILGGVGKAINHYFGESIKDKLFRNAGKSGSSSKTKGNTSTSKEEKKASTKAKMSSSKSSAGEWNKLEKQAAPINNLSRSVNKKLDIIIKLMGGNPNIEGGGAGSGGGGLFSRIGDWILGTLLGGTALGRVLGIGKGKNAKIPKTGEVPKTGKVSENVRKTSGTRETVKVPKEVNAAKTATKGAAKTTARIKPNMFKPGGGKFGWVGPALTGVALGAGGVATVNSLNKSGEDVSTGDAVTNAAINGVATGLETAYYTGTALEVPNLVKAGKATVEINKANKVIQTAKTVKEVNAAKNTLQAATLAKGAAFTGGKFIPGVGLVASYGSTVLDIVDKQNQREAYLEQAKRGDDRAAFEAAKLRVQQINKGINTVAGTVVGGIFGGVGGASAGAALGDIGGDISNWAIGKIMDYGYKKYQEYKDKKEKARLEKIKMETDKEVANLKNYKVLEMSEQLNVVIQLLSELAVNLSASTQSDLDRQYINMIMQGNYVSPNPSYPSNSNTSVDMNVINPAGG